MSATPALELRGVTRRFGALVANDAVDLDASAGEIVAIVGENGAGKSTLMNVLFGLHRPDAGEIRVNGTLASFASPADAIAAGIGMVHQHFHLVPTLTVAENVALGHEPRNGLFFDRRAAEESVRALASELAFTLDPAALVRDLPVGVQQRVEIVKSLSRGARVLILDEPTAVLTPQEADDLFRVLRELAGRGRTILFISHKLGEVMALSSRVVVMRGGRVVATVETARTTARELATLMVGREPVASLARGAEAPGAAALSISGLELADDRGLPALRGVSLEVRAGEILGIAGVEGNGQTELVEALVGLRRARSGEVRLLGADVTSETPAAIAARGVAHVPGDRLASAVIRDMTLEENLVLGRHRESTFAGRLGIRRDEVRRHARETIERFDVRPGDPSRAIATLSGGNQQKAVVGRELGRAPKVLIAVHPTRGVDVGAIEEIHRRILAERDRGTAVLLVSADLGEVLALSDRVAVLYAGRVVHTTDARATSERALGPWMTGAQR